VDVISATRTYEQWLRGQTSVVVQDLKFKHQRMADNPFAFFRGTFYRWLQLWPALCAAVADAPAVPCVGDLHVENFGTWRDAEGRLVWGVNDVDEACVLPYTNDLVRLAASAILATRGGRFTVQPRELCDALLDGYSASLDRGGEALVLEERHRWLRRLALNELREPKVFWSKLEKSPHAAGEIPRAVFKSTMPSPTPPYRVVRRVAGVGSLGRRRIVAIAEWGGARIAREAKAFVPSAAVWATGSTAVVDGARLLAQAVRAPDPFFTRTPTWIVRRLSPHCSRIELEDLPRARDEERLVRAMGWETANLHLRGRTRIRADLNKRRGRWLETAAAAMANAAEKDWRQWHEWCSSHG
jgi:hypothetical protein